VTALRLSISARSLQPVANSARTPTRWMAPIIALLRRSTPCRIPCCQTRPRPGPALGHGSARARPAVPVVGAVEEPLSGDVDIGWVVGGNRPEMSAEGTEDGEGLTSVIHDGLECRSLLILAWDPRADPWVDMTAFR